jgi:hypothetical protein
MAVTAFQKGNRRATAGSDKATVYLPSGIAAITNLNSTNAQTIQSVVPFQFKGNGQVEVTTPMGFTLPNGASIGSATLIQNGSGSYAAGFHPLVQFTVGSGTANVNVNATDVLIVQY